MSSPRGTTRLESADLARLFEALQAAGYAVVGPTVRDEAIVYAELAGPEELPRGWTDEQAPGRYRLRRRDDGALFGYAVGPHSWKQLLHPPEQRVWRAERDPEGALRFVPEDLTPRPRALLGVRGCELAALRVQDRVLQEGPAPDPGYAARRAAAFLVAVECTAPAATCFCTSFDTGPGVEQGYDLALTEVCTPDAHYFLVAAGSDRGREVAAQLPLRPAEPAEREAGEAAVAAAAAAITRRLPQEGLPQALAQALEHPRWDDVAARCLTCGNCTLVCPTCFCTTVEDTADVQGAVAERWRRWDSCFSLDFSALHGGSVRSSSGSRYRQWLTHKLSTWHDQFGSSGCVGCGRCLTWCPVGIDLTEEAAALRQEPHRAHD
ncbi:MAG: 4Fe-4S dicluster domain-containing protein [Planctomycetota bacterium]